MFSNFIQINSTFDDDLLHCTISSQYYLRMFMNGITSANYALHQLELIR